MGKRVTIKDISNELGVSLSIINRVLNNKPGVSKEMRERVLESAERLGYRKNKVAQSMARSCIQIGVVIPLEWPEYYNSLKKGLDEEFTRLYDYNVESKYYYVENNSSGKKTAELLGKCIEDGLNGVIVCDAFPIGLEKTFSKLNEKKIPVVLVGDSKSLSNRYLCSIQIDAYCSGRMAAEMLSLSISDCSNAIVFVGNKDNAEHYLKINGFTDEANKRGLNILGVYETHDDDEIAYQLVKRVFEKNKNMIGIYSATANSASVCRFVEESGASARIIVTDVYSKTVEYLKKGVIEGIIFQNLEKHGRTAIKVLYDYITENKPTSNKIYIAPQLVLNSNLSNYFSDDDLMPSKEKQTVKSYKKQNES